MTPLEIAAECLACGYAPIPIPLGQKNPVLTGWQNLRISEDELERYFGTPCNIGVLMGEPSDWLIDLDLDHPLAVELAPKYLPPTGMIFGRDSKPRSHWEYVVAAPVKTTREKTANGAMIVELRSTGCQTIWPGSIHPSGEAVRWDVNGSPQRVELAVLVAAKAALAEAVRERLGEGPALSPARSTSPPRPLAPAAAAVVTTPYGRAALDRETTRVSGTGEGGRNDALNEAAFNLGTLVGGGEIDEAEATGALTIAAAQCGLPEGEAAKTIQSGMTAGKANPRTAPQAAVRHNPQNSRDSRGSVSVRGKPSAFQPFPLLALPEPLRGFVITASKAIGCDPSYVALPGLGGAAGAIGNTRRVQLKPGWSEPAVLWVADVGDSGTLKSPAVEAPLHPIRERQKEAFKAHAKAMEVHEFEVKEYESKMQEWKRSGRKAGMLQPEPPKEPVCERFWCSDVTVEALADRLLGASRGILIIRDELSGWLKSFDQYRGGKGGDAAHWLSMHRADALLVDRKTGDKQVIYVPHAAVSIVGGIQPGILRRALGQEHFENGMAARILLTMPPKRPRRWNEHGIDEAAEKSLNDMFAALLNLKQDVRPNEDPRPRLLRLSPEAKRLWIEFYNEHGEEQADLSGDLAAAWSKLEGYAARFALIHHCIRCAANDPTVVDPDIIDEVSMRDAITLTRWFANETRRVYAVLAESEDDQEIRHHVEIIQRQGGGVTPRQWQRLRSLATVELAEKELTRLVEAEAGSWVQLPAAPNGGPPTREFRLAPTSDTDTTPQNPGENGVVSEEDGTGGAP